MDDKVKILLDNKNENVVQFNLVNTTNQNQFIDLFNTDNLNPVSTSLNYIFPPNTLTSSFGVGTFQIMDINTSNGYLYATVGSTIVSVFDTNNNNTPLPNITLPTGVLLLVYNSISNTIYLASQPANLIYVVDANTNLIITSIPFVGTISNLLFTPITNSIYVSNTINTEIIDCNTNTISLTLLNPYSDAVFNPSDNLVYAVSSFNSLYDVIDPTTNNLLQSIPFISASTIGLNPNPLSPFVYIAEGGTGDVYIYNWSVGNSFVSQFSPSIGVLSFSTYDSVSNNVYFGSLTGNLLAINGTNFQTSFIASSLLITPIVNTNTNSVYFTAPTLNNILQVTTIGITATNFFISGSSNYNTFVNNLNNEPVFIQMIRLLVQNQEQLFNQIQFTKIDSNGNQLFTPEFPITKIDTDQEQGNIASIDLKNLVFDGRTYINQYQLNPLQTISFEIYYKQLDLSSATNKYPILFKPKVQLIEYIKGNK